VPKQQGEHDLKPLQSGAQDCGNLLEWNSHEISHADQYRHSIYYEGNTEPTNGIHRLNSQIF
jgi:hypothetical protein